jgi:hypothetical protein
MLIIWVYGQTLIRVIITEGPLDRNDASERRREQREQRSYLHKRDARLMKQASGKRRKFNWRRDTMWTNPQPRYSRKSNDSVGYWGNSSYRNIIALRCSNLAAYGSRIQMSQLASKRIGVRNACRIDIFQQGIRRFGNGCENI